MNAKYAPGMAALLILLSGAQVLPCLAQLPPVNMSKSVRTPGDNQYTEAGQSWRHGYSDMRPDVLGRPQIRQAAGGGGAGVSVVVPLTPPPKRPDISIEPIAADEPVPPAGFPPLPDRLDLPIASAGGWKGGSGGGGWSGGGGGSAGGGGGGGASPTFHQHYGHVAPGAYLKGNSQGNPNEPGGGGGEPAPGMSGGSGGGGGGHGYYKAITPPPIQKQGQGYYKARTPGQSGGGDYFNSNTGGAPGMSPPAYSGATSKDLKNLGKEPKLNDRQEQTQAPDAPQPVTVNQATTQDLSLPEDEFAYKAKQKSAAGKFGKSAVRAIKKPLNSVGGMAGIRF